tara:strand:- start:131 stop:481 length:351 start_codon:yes stop_codon:yes gene_type:complete
MLVIKGLAFSMENKFVFSGWALSLFGAVNIVGLLYGYSFVTSIASSSGVTQILLLTLISLSIAVSFLALLSGVYLLKNNDAVHKVALPVSFAIMISVPIGTAVGALYLWQRYESSK